MKAEHAEEYTQALGQIVAGGWRQIALGEKLGVPRALGLSTRDWVEQRLGGYVKLSIDEKHGAVKELQADGMSTRQIAGVLGIGKSQVSEIGQSHSSSPGGERNPISQMSGSGQPVDAIAALAVGEVKEKQEKRREREDELRQRRAEQESRARSELAASGEQPQIVVADIRDWRPSPVHAIITDPPYIGDSIPLYGSLRDFAADTLIDGGPLVVMTWQAILPDVIRALDHPDLIYRWTICWRFANNENTADQKRRVFDCWKPILIYHKGGMPTDAAMIRDEIANEITDKDFHEWGQSVDGFGRLVRSFSQPGQTVCDPFLGGGTTAVAALAEARRFIGCDVDPVAVETTTNRLAA